MFTGIVTEVGTVREAREEGDLRLLIGTSRICPTSILALRSPVLASA